MPAARSVDDVCVSTELPTTGLRIKVKKVSSAKLVSLAAEHKRVAEAETLHGNNILNGQKFGRNLRREPEGCQDVRDIFCMKGGWAKHVPARPPQTAQGQMPCRRAGL